MNNVAAPVMKSLADVIGAAVLTDDLQGVKITGIQTDSRLIEKGNLFIALKGARDSGMNYISDVESRGAVAILADSDITDLEEDGFCKQLVSIPIICIGKLTEKLGQIVASYFDKPSEKFPVFGVTGTNGKSSYVHIMASIMQVMGKGCGVIGTLGYGVFGKEIKASHTTPDVIRVHKLLSEMYVEGVAMAVMEVSSHGLSQGRVDAVRFDTAVFTNLSRDHLDYHGDMESYGKAKLKLFQMHGLKYAVVNLDDPFSDEIIQTLPVDVTLISYSINNKQADVYADQPVYHSRGVRTQVFYRNQMAQLDCPLLGEFNLSNVLAVLSALLVHDYPLYELVKLFDHIPFVPGRLQVVGNLSPVVIVDYAHTPDALEKALLAIRKHFPGKLLWCVFGCGGNRDIGKRALMAKAAESFADRIVITSDNPRTESPCKIIEDICAGLKNDKQAIIKPERSDGIDYALRCAGQNEVVLVAGKGHEDYQEVNGEREPFSDLEYIRQQINRQNGESVYD